MKQLSREKALPWGSPEERRQADLFYADLIGQPLRGFQRALVGKDAFGEALDVNDTRRKTFREMWSLMARFRWPDTPALFTNELMLGICWEESTFMNIWQQGNKGAKGPAKGFGQIEPSALSLAKIKFRMEEPIAQLQDMMDADEYSISFIGRVLHTLHDNMLAERQSQSREPEKLKRRVLLSGYAGYPTDHAQWRVEVVDGWYAFERELLNGGRGSDGYPLRDAAIRALDVGTPDKRKFQDRAVWQRFIAKVCEDLPTG